jgi:hypothetical protein
MNLALPLCVDLLRLVHFHLLCIYITHIFHLGIPDLPVNYMMLFCITHAFYRLSHFFSSITCNGLYFEFEYTSHSQSSPSELHCCGRCTLPTNNWASVQCVRLCASSRDSSLYVTSYILHPAGSRNGELSIRYCAGWFFWAGITLARSLSTWPN